MTDERRPRTVGYLRVSRQEQDLDKNRADILALANNREDLGRVECVEEKASGRVGCGKRGIADILEELREGDVPVVSEPSRFGRSMPECMEILSFAADSGIRAFAIKGSRRLDEPIQSRIIAMVFPMAAVYLKALAAEGLLEEIKEGREDLCINPPLLMLLSERAWATQHFRPRATKDARFLCQSKK
ncbi:MAG: hypothetical protein F4103_01970 [Boseongicola sp. SB0673_bin_14]|nr:hypothetical protein [Boseongicola sp. SB0673_bin_14]